MTDRIRYRTNWILACRFTLALTAASVTLAIAFDIPPVRADNSYADFSTDPAAIYGREALYDVFRNDKKVGTHSVVFRKSEGRLQVEVNSSLVVRYLRIPVYRYSYTAIEEWVGGKLQSVESRIRDNYKEERVITAVNKGRILQITDRGKIRTAPVTNFPSNHWHPAVVHESRVLHTLHGKVHRVKIHDKGTGKVQLTGSDKSGAQRTAVVSARHYQYTGGFVADVWYDQDNRWIRLVFEADDGSSIDYRCVTCMP